MSRERERTSSSVPSAARIASPVNGARSSTSRSVVIAFGSSERGVNRTGERVVTLRDFSGEERGRRSAPIHRRGFGGTC